MKTKLTFIAAQKTRYSVRRLCAALGVSRAWVYGAVDPARAERLAQKDAAEQEDLAAIHVAFDRSRKRYGAPRIHADLRRQGREISRWRVAKLMKENGIRPQRRRRRRPVTTDSRHAYRVAPNLLERNFSAQEPDQVWLADISYVPTDEGWLYVAAVKDLATCEIVGWSLSDSLKSQLCLDALGMAVRNRRPAPGLIQHSDRGVQYACDAYARALETHGMRASMSRKGDCLDNAPMESFFSSLKTELVHRTRFRTRAEARATLFEYIEVFYNRHRLHSSLGYRTPLEAREDMTAALTA